MARIRTIKPEFWVDEKVVECSAFARLLFIGLWNFADDEGRMEYRPAKLKMQIFPADSLDISELVGELRRERLVTVYTVEDKDYLQIRGFSKHQKVDKRTPSKLPAPESSPEPPRIVPTEGIKEGIKEGKGNGSRKGEKTPVAFASEPDAVSDVFAYWQSELNHGRAKLDAKRKRKIRDRLKDGYTPADLMAAIRGCKKSPHHMGQNDTGTVYDDIELICRDGPHVDKFIRLDSAPDVTGLSGAGRKTVSAAKAWLEESNASQ